MAEIKSTLDIIMEKAKKFSVTEEEKKGFKRQELESKIKGLVQKHLDSFIDLDRLRDELAQLQRKGVQMVQDLVKEEALGRIQPGQGNEFILDMLSKTTGMNTGPIKELLNKFEGSIDQEKERRLNILQEELRRRGISGPAVIPNLNADETWIKTLSRAVQEFREELKSLS